MLSFLVPFLSCSDFAARFCFVEITIAVSNRIFFVHLDMSLLLHFITQL